MAKRRDYDPDEEERSFSAEDEINDPLIRISDVERVFLETGVVPKHQVPLIIEKLREECNGEALDLGNDFELDDEDDEDYIPEAF